MTVNPRIFCLVATVTLAAMTGCGDDDGTGPPFPPKEYVYVETQRVTGFYIGPTDGGAITIVVDRYAEKGASAPASLTTPGAVPQGARATMWPDDGRTPIHLTGYEANNTLYLSGGGYDIDAPTNNFKYPFYDQFAGPKGVGFLFGYVSSVESVNVFLGSFTGDSLAGRWHFAVRDTSAAPDSSKLTIEGFAINSSTGSEISIEGTLRSIGSTYQIELSGGLHPALRWIGYGTFGEGGAFASGTWQIQDDLDHGTWSSTRFDPPAP